MRLGDLLVKANKVTEDDVARALKRVGEHGGRLGDNLVAIGALDQRTLDNFLHRIPGEPPDIKATGIDENDLLSLLMKLIFTARLETAREMMDAIKLPYHILSELLRMAVDRQLVHTMGTRSSDNMLDMGYSMTENGKQLTMEALQRLHYVGPAPIPIAEFSDQVNLQKLTNEVITLRRIHESVGYLELPQNVIDQIGPALNSGRAILMYGPPGNGKTTVALNIASVFQDVIYIPYAVEVEGQIIRVFDSSIHHQVSPASAADDAVSFVRTEQCDARWVPCRRPFVITGGELTLEMLDLRYDTAGHYYEAPLHMKALGGCFLIDDFGRQLVSPINLLNRWMVPLENRVDYLKLHTGKTFSIPFDELVIFSTNLEPEDLMDLAFLRRLPYKIEVTAPSLARFKRIVELECKRQGVPLPEEALNAIVYKVKTEKGLELAAYQPRFIVDQVVASCRFMGEPPHFEPRYLECAIENLCVRRSAPAKR